MTETTQTNKSDERYAATQYREIMWRTRKWQHWRVTQW